MNNYLRKKMVQMYVLLLCSMQQLCHNPRAIDFYTLFA